MDRLGVVEATREVGLLSSDPANASNHRSLDWTVNSKPLRTLLGWKIPPKHSTCMVTGWDLNAALAGLDGLRVEGAGGFPDGRVAVLVCEECGDLECGALSVRVKRQAGVVGWSDFGWQVPSEDGFGPLEEPLSFEFAADEYDALLDSLAHRLAEDAITVPTRRRPWRTPKEGRLIIQL